MAIPTPEQGLVIRFSYLWDREAAQGEEAGRKDLPCAVVLSATRQDDGAVRVMVAPITHSPPAVGTDALEIPARVGANLRLDAQRSWIVTSEVNMFTWPGTDLQPAVGADFAFGFLPRKLSRLMRDAVIAQMGKARKLVERDDPPAPGTRR